jgi:Dynamin family
MKGSESHKTPFDSSRYAKRINDVQDLLKFDLPNFELKKDRKPVLHPPKVLVLGNQDVGKTALISTLAQVPISRTVTTRCPIEIQLRRRREDEIECGYKVSVEFRGNSDGNVVVAEWPATEEKGEVKGLLTSAQYCVLKGEMGTRLCDSNYVIVLRINCAALDLTLVDLPGLNYMVRNILPLS